jgi:hypothetical protein
VEAPGGYSAVMYFVATVLLIERNLLRLVDWLCFQSVYIRFISSEHSVPCIQYIVNAYT